ncbi:hypothetical protein LTR53_012778 [Teratosphaeriaceae sp. CCFEE 6253]|nr:hypothetical protein LTR53_012778 [Teratosphaeriaceae sp. CCFEE 6253]
MTTLVPRPPYSPAEFSALYPPGLELQQVQILLRHGERTPVSARFKNTGLATHWPYCAAANQLRHAVLAADGTWSTLQWRRAMETLDPATHGPTPALSQTGQNEAICESGELTDLGRQTTLALGHRLRGLTDTVVLRSTPVPRALESVQQAFVGLYPAASRAADLPPKAIVRRAQWEETLFPNESYCPRFGELAKAFGARAAALYNDGPEIKYLNSKLGKYMPAASPEVKVDSHPRLSGIMDSINATRAHADTASTRLPAEFYEERVLGTVDKICVEEWFGGYAESAEYRKLGIGGLVGDLTQRMVERTRALGDKSDREGAEGQGFKLSMAGCHDTTLAAALTALGVFDVKRDHWPNFTSNIAFELFRRKNAAPAPVLATPQPATNTAKPSWWSSLFSSPSTPASATAAPEPRTPFKDLPLAEQAKLDGHFIRLRYNDTPVTIPYCRQPGKHWEGDESFCTLAAFKEVADSFTPGDWRVECKMNLGTPGVPGMAGGPEVERVMGVGGDDELPGKRAIDR